MKVTLRKNKRARRKLSIRKTVFGTSSKPRLSVFRSNRYVFAQLIDDTKGITLAGVSITDVVAEHKKASKTTAAREVGKKIAQLGLEKKIERIVFDRNGYKYHGRVKEVAEGAREGGLKF